MTYPQKDGNVARAVRVVEEHYGGPLATVSALEALTVRVAALESGEWEPTLPPERDTEWNPGVTGGIPDRETIHATISAATYSNGAVDATAGIQAALNACTVGQVVALSAGTFLINGTVPLILNKGITLRGAGPESTFLVRTNGAVEGTYLYEVQAPIVIVGTRFGTIDNANSQNLTVDGVKGEYTITVADGTDFEAGDFVLLDEDHLTTGVWQALPNRGGVPTNVRIWGTDKVTWSWHDPEHWADSAPESGSWYSRPGRVVSEVKEIESVDGNVITFVDPLHIAYRVNYAAQIAPYSQVTVQDAGVEDLSMEGGSWGNIQFDFAAHSWVKNCEAKNYLGHCVTIYNSTHIEVRDSYIHHSVNPYPGGGAYLVTFLYGSSDVLVENNIIVDSNKCMVSMCAGAGCVVAYNYTDDPFIGNQLLWQEVGINGSHMPGSHNSLFEGNYSPNYDSDNTHGSAIYHTVFRNHLSGVRRSYPGPGRCAGLMFGSWWHSFIGNVLGLSGQTSGWIDEPTGINGDWGTTTMIWRLGYDPVNWNQDFDPKVRSTVIREGNFDYVTNEVRWDTSAVPLASSMYLAAKPAFFGSYTWPWVDPLGATKLYTLPAKARFDAETPFAPPP